MCSTIHTLGPRYVTVGWLKNSSPPPPSRGPPPGVLVEDSDSFAGSRLGARESRTFGRRSLGKATPMERNGGRSPFRRREDRATRSERLRDGRGSPGAPGEGTGPKERALLRRCPPSRLRYRSRPTA